MDQISPPMRIVLVVAIVFAAAYMLVLKPSDEAPPVPEPAPAVQAGGPEANTALGTAVEQANEAANASEAASAAHGAESTSSESNTANPPASTQAAPEAPTQKPADSDGKPVPEELKDLPGWLAQSLDNKVVAVLFTNAESADDRRTSKALQKAYDYDGDVVTRVVNVKKISDYQAIAEGVDVSQSPTLMVIAKDRSAAVLPGFSSRNTISQAIIDAQLVTDNPLESVPFLQKVQTECKAISNQDIIGETEGTTPAGARRNVQATIAEMGSSLRSLRGAKAPAAYKSQKALVTRWLASEIRVGNQLLPVLGGKAIDPIKVNAIVGSNDKLATTARVELNAVGVSTCN